MVQKLESKWLCRDPIVCKEWAEDPLCHDTGTLEGLSGMLDRADELNRGLVTIREGRVWVGHGSADRVCSFDAARGWFERLGVQDKDFKTYEGWYHKRECMPGKTEVSNTNSKSLIVHAEPGEDKITFANDVADWILARAEVNHDPNPSQAKSRL